MSQENVELVRGMCEAFMSGDFTRALDVLHADVVWHGTIGGLEEQRTAHGQGEVIEEFLEYMREWERLTLEAEGYRDAGDDVVVLWHETARGRESGIEVETRTAAVYTVRDGAVVEVQSYMDRGRALEAVGLTE
jgi:ketosteroid isomerase-like protein